MASRRGRKSDPQASGDRVRATREGGASRAPRRRAGTEYERRGEAVPQERPAGERGTSDEGGRCLKSAPQAGGEQRTSDEGRRCLKSAPQASGEQRTSDEGRRCLKE